MQSHSSILCKAVFRCSACSLTFFCKSGAKVFRTTSRFPTSRDFDHWNRQYCPWLHLDRTWTSWMSHPDNPAVHGMNVSRIRFPNKIIDIAIYQMWLIHTHTISYPEMPCQMHIPIPSIQIDWVGHCKVQSRVWLTFGCLGANPALRLRNFEKSWADLSVRTATLTISWGIDQTNYTEIHWLLQVQDPEQLPA